MDGVCGTMRPYPASATAGWKVELRVDVLEHRCAWPMRVPEKLLVCVLCRMPCAVPRDRVIRLYI